MRAKQKALLVVDLARAKKAEDMVVLDMRKVSNITDFFIIATSDSIKRAQTIADNIEEGLLKAKERILNIEGYQEAGWIAIDASDVVVHIFDSKLRRFYNLEALWSDAQRIRLCQKKKKRPLKRNSRKK